MKDIKAFGLLVYGQGANPYLIREQKKSPYAGCLLPFLKTKHNKQAINITKGNTIVSETSAQKQALWMTACPRPFLVKDAISTSPEVGNDFSTMTAPTCWPRAPLETSRRPSGPGPGQLEPAKPLSGAALYTAAQLSTRSLSWWPCKLLSPPPPSNSFPSASLGVFFFFIPRTELLPGL